MRRRGDRGGEGCVCGGGGSYVMTDALTIMLDMGMFGITELMTISNKHAGIMACYQCCNTNQSVSVIRIPNLTDWTTVAVITT